MRTYTRAPAAASSWQASPSHCKNTTASKTPRISFHAPRSAPPRAVQCSLCAASCHANGSLTLLFMPISRHSQNVLRSPTHAASISVGPARPAAARARVALTGTVTVFTDLHATPDRARLEACYLAAHPDARHWLPGPREPHIVSRPAVHLVRLRGRMVTCPPRRFRRRTGRASTPM